MNKVEKQYYLIGQSLDQSSLIELSKSKINSGSVDNWEKEIFKFILEWFDENDFIKVNTSGSTGKPKAISLKKKHMAESAHATLNFLGIKEEDKALLCLPANYIAGKMMIVRVLIGGLDLNYVQPSLNPEFSQNEQFKLLAVVPSMLADIIKSGKIKDLEHFENILIGGSEISPKDEKELSALNNKIWHTYGMTETITHIALRKVNGADRSDWFTPMKGVKISISKDDALVIDYNNIGVLNLTTNDLAEINKNGDFKILGRKDNVIISGSLKLYPEELEKKIADIIESDFFIYGISDEKLGQKVVLFIEDRDVKTEKVIITGLSQKLSKIELPKEIFWIKQFDRTPNGKILRRNYLQDK